METHQIKTTKLCRTCNVEKSVNDFYKSKRDGLQSKCKTCSYQSGKKWAKNNADKLREYRKKYAERIKDYQQEYYSIPKNKIKIRLAARMHSSNIGVVPAVHPIEGLGCTIEQFINHLESLFQEGMTWENFGKGKGNWSMDHIKPVSAFDLTDEKQCRECMHFTNIRPLWDDKNTKKQVREYYESLN